MPNHNMTVYPSDPDSQNKKKLTHHNTNTHTRVLIILKKTFDLKVGLKVLIDRNNSHYAIYLICMIWCRINGNSSITKQLRLLTDKIPSIYFYKLSPLVCILKRTSSINKQHQRFCFEIHADSHNTVCSTYCTYMQQGISIKTMAFP